MKAKIFTVLGSLVVSSILYAQNIQVTDKWQLLGALENISSSSFDGKCVDFVWTYNNGWQVHIANGKNYNLPSGIKKFDIINKGQGFWIKGNGSCKVNTSNNMDIHTLLAGKTFYTVDEDNNNNLQVTKLIFNNSLNSIEAISPNSTENWGININGNRLTFSDDTDGSYTIIKPMNDYILFEDHNSDGSLDGKGHRLYVNKSDAEAYLSSLQGNNDLKSLIVGKTFYVIEDDNSIHTLIFQQNGIGKYSGNNVQSFKYTILHNVLTIESPEGNITFTNVKQYNDYLKFTGINGEERGRFFFTYEAAKASIN